MPGPLTLGEIASRLGGRVAGDAGTLIRQIAEQEKFDIIFQDAVFASPRIDITEKVIKALEAAKPPAK